MLAALVLAAALVSGPAPPEGALIYCRSLGITDGDTFRCDGGVRIRLWGINAPERDAPGGVAATRALANLTHARDVVCRRRGKSYDRIVAQCWTGGRDLAGELVRKGHAEDWPKFSKGYYARGAR